MVLGPSRPPRTIDRTANFATLPRGAGDSERKLKDGVVLFSGAKFLPMYDFSLPERGLYRVRMKIRAEQSGTLVFMHVKGGNTGRIPSHTVGFFEALPGKLTTVEFTDRAPERSDNFAIGLNVGYPYWKVNPDEYKGPGLFIGDISRRSGRRMDRQPTTTARRPRSGNRHARRHSNCSLESASASVSAFGRRNGSCTVRRSRQGCDGRRKGLRGGSASWT
jgi:hypothetical protein